jgi:hypothetical protein
MACVLDLHFLELHEQLLRFHRIETVLVRSGDDSALAREVLWPRAIRPRACTKWSRIMTAWEAPGEPGGRTEASQSPIGAVMAGDKSTRHLLLLRYRIHSRGAGALWLGRWQRRLSSGRRWLRRPGSRASRQAIRRLAVLTMCSTVPARSSLGVKARADQSRSAVNLHSLNVTRFLGGLRLARLGPPQSHQRHEV